MPEVKLGHYMAGINCNYQLIGQSRSKLYVQIGKYIGGVESKLGSVMA